MFFLKLSGGMPQKLSVEAFHVEPSEAQVREAVDAFVHKLQKKEPNLTAADIVVGHSQWTDQIISVGSKPKKDEQISFFDLTEDLPELDKEEAKAAKRLLGLPLTKQMVFMEMLSYLNYKPIPITYVGLNRQYDEWCSLRVSLENGETICIHHMFLAQMQRPNFLDVVSGNSEE